VESKPLLKPATLAVVAGTLWCVFTYGPAPGAAQDFPARMQSAKKAATKDLTLSLEAGAGLGNFQDIQVPLNEDANMRGDGTVPGTENAEHSGFPIYGGLGLSYALGRWDFAVGVDGLQMRAATGPAETQSSSYSRVEAGVGASYVLPVGSSALSLGLSFAGRRSAYSNVSNGHYIQGLVVRGDVGWFYRSFALTGFAGVAPSPTFGYNDEGSFGGKAFAGSQSSLTELGILGSYNVRDRVWVDCGLEQELVSASISDIEQYNGFGLAVTTDTPRRTRQYDLATSILRFGVRKEL
jgi:hypothetical protein